MILSKGKSEISSGAVLAPGMKFGHAGRCTKAVPLPQCLINAVRVLKRGYEKPRCRKKSLIRQGPDFKVLPGI